MSSNKSAASPSEQGLHACEKCHKVFFTKYTLQTHVANLHREKGIMCGQRWWKIRGNLAIRLPGSFLACKRKCHFLPYLKRIGKKKREVKSF